MAARSSACSAPGARTGSTSRCGEAWRRGVVLCGLSAGSLCWFSEAVTAFHGTPQAVEGLGLLPHSNCVHYDGEPCRRQEYRRFIRDGMCAGYAADDGAALHFVGTDLHRVVASRPGKRGWRVALRGDRVVERKLATVDLGAPLRAASREDHPRPGRRWVHRPAGRPGARRARAAAGGQPGAADPLPAHRQRRPARPDRGASTPPSATVRASRRCSRSFAWATCAARCATSSSPRTSSTSAAARCATCWPSGRSHGLDRMLRDAWERGVVLAGLSAGAMCWMRGGVTTSSGAPEPTPGLGPAARVAVRARRHRAGAPRGLPGRGGRRDPAAGVARRRRRRPALPRHASSSASSRRGRGRGPRASTSSTARSSSVPIEPDLIAPAPRGVAGRRARAARAARERATAGAADR